MDETIVGRLVDRWIQNDIHVGASRETLYLDDQCLRRISGGIMNETLWTPISFRPSPFLLRIGEARVFASSALDCLLIPIFLKTSVEVHTLCPTNGTEIALRLNDKVIDGCIPSGCVFSVTVPDASRDSRPESSKGPYPQGWQLMRFFSSRTAAALWLVAYQNMHVLDIDEAWLFVNLLYQNGEQSVSS